AIQDRLDFGVAQCPAWLPAHDAPPPLSLVGGSTGFPAFVIAAATRSTAAAWTSRYKWLYLLVVVGLRCPSRLPISGQDAPPATSSLAKLCRRSWMRNPLIFAALSIFDHCRHKFTAWPRLLWLGNTKTAPSALRL